MNPSQMRAEAARLDLLVGSAWISDEEKAKACYALAAQVPALLDEKEAALAENATLRQRIAELERDALCKEREEEGREFRKALLESSELDAAMQSQTKEGGK